jgi:hypothetical protein
MKRLLLLLFFLPIASAAIAQVNSFQIDSSKFDQKLMRTLDSLLEVDQSIRTKWMDLAKAKAKPFTIDSIKAVARRQDSSNLMKVKDIISRHGWLGPQDVGMNASQGLFLVIQHADLATQQKYLPMIRQAEKDGKTLSSNLAILEDRIAMREGRKQSYGSQGFADKVTGTKYIYPITDPDQLDSRRKAMGMPPMKEYVPGWDLEKYKTLLPELEKIVKQQGIR